MYLLFVGFQDYCRLLKGTWEKYSGIPHYRELVAFDKASMISFRHQEAETKLTRVLYITTYFNDV